MGSRRTAPIILKIIFVLIFSGLLAYWAGFAVSKYIDQPVSTFVSYTQGDDNINVTLPHVTFCDENFVINDPQLKNCMTQQNEVNAKAQGLDTSKGNNFLDVIGNCLKKGVNMNDYLKSLEEKKLSDFIGDHQMTDSTFNKSFHTKYDLSYGLCVEFDASKADMKVDDPDLGLFLKLRIPSVANSIKATLHTDTDYPDACSLYPCFNLKQNNLQSLALKKFMVTRESTRKSICMDYNQKTCMEVKSNQEIMDRFKCKLIFLATGDHLDQHIKGYSDLPICNDTSVMVQAIAIFQKAMKEKNDGECTQAVSCQRQKFDVTTTESVDGGFAHTYFQMVYKDLEVEHFVTYISYDAQSLICELGGVLGMFLGLSGVSIGYFCVDCTERHLYDRVENPSGTCCTGFTRKFRGLRKRGIKKRKRGKTIWLIVSVANIGLLALIVLLASMWPSENVKTLIPESTSSTEQSISTTTSVSNVRTCHSGYEDKAPYITLLHGNCYFASIEAMDYNSAMEFCKAKFGSQGILAEPQNEVANNDMYDWSRNVVPTRQFWIGINDIQNEGVWSYQSSGLPAAYLKWEDGQPDSLNEHCVEVKSKGLWNDDLCHVAKSFICQYNTTSPFPVTEKPASGDPGLENCTYLNWVGDGFCDDVTNIPDCQMDGGDCCLPEPVYTFCSSCQCLACQERFWDKAEYITAANGLCYYVETELMDYSSAIANCKTLFGSEAYLAEPQSLEESNDIYQRVSDILPSTDFWLGINDIEQEGVWVYQSSGLPLAFQNWFPGEPNDNNGEEDCAQFNLGKMNDVVCWVGFKAICQFNLTSTVPDTEISGSGDPGLENCTQPSWIGDGFCDDLTNTPACQMDGGDCCLPEPIKSFCSSCKCQSINALCIEGFDLLSDGNCDDINNIAECSFDGGDCCESQGGAPAWIGDGWCDDLNNIAECDYDDGDCCLDDILSDYCTVCECLEN